MLWEKKLAQWSAAVRDRANLPARLTLWDGQSYDFGNFSGPSVTLHVKSPAALSLMLQPTLDNLGEAYVKSKIDIEGKLSDVIDIAYGLAKTSIDKQGGALQNMARYFTHTPGRRTRSPSSTTTTFPTSSTSSGWTRTWSIHAPTSRTATKTSRPRS